MSPVRFVKHLPGMLRVFPPRARKGFPQASALRLCSPRALSAALQGWEIPLPLQLLPPTFARRRSAFVFQMPSTTRQNPRRKYP